MNKPLQPYKIEFNTDDVKTVIKLWNLETLIKDAQASIEKSIRMIADGLEANPEHRPFLTSENTISTMTEKEFLTHGK